MAAVREYDYPWLLDPVAGRSGPALSGWVNQRPPEWRDPIAVAALDPFRGYATPPPPATSLPAATRVLDRFHVTRLGRPDHRPRRPAPLRRHRPHPSCPATAPVADLLHQHRHRPTARPGPHHRCLASGAADRLRHRRRLQRLTEATSLLIKKGETVRPPWIPQREPTHARQRSSRPNRTASSNASQDASMMFGCTPTVVHSALLSDVSMSTRVMASVPCLPGRMRTL